MTKGQMHFSNDFGRLIPILKESLYPPGANPFEKRLVIVPHLGLKMYLLQELCKDRDWQIVAGLEVTNITEGFAKITKTKIPSKLELSLFLEHELLSLIEKEEELITYFPVEKKEKRIGPFSDALAEYFLRYAIFGKPLLPDWQETLWKRWNWSFPHIEKTKWQVHLFGFSFLPQFYFSFFSKMNSQFYFFSPCEIYWADFYNIKEKQQLQKNVPKQQMDFFEESFSQQNPLLASWGKVGRKTLLMVEDWNISTQEHYLPIEGDLCLQKVQKDLLSGDFIQHPIDESLAFVSASSFFGEVEVLKEKITYLCQEKKMEPKDIQVFAPDISLYAPYIHALFEDFPYKILDIPFQEEDRIAKNFAKMLALPTSRFSIDEVLQVLSTLSFFEIDLSLVRKWVEEAQIHWGLSKEQKMIFYLKDFSQDQICMNTDEGTWEKGFHRLLWGLGHSDGIQGIAPSEMVSFNQFYILMHSLFEDLSPLYDGTKWTVSTWLRYFACLMESYFVVEPSHEVYKQFLHLAASCDPLDQEKVTFEEIKRVLDSLLNKKNKSYQSHFLQAVHFGSFLEGCMRPSKAIFLLGMNEETFPRKEGRTSLYFGEKDFRPTTNQKDRYLFLQALCFAKEFFCASFMQEKGPSFVLQELIATLEGAEIVNHREKHFDFEPKQPLIPEFFAPVSLQIRALVPMEIEIQKLFKFARHPLRYYLHEILGIYPDFNKSENKEFLLDPLAKYQKVREILKGSLPETLLPSHLLQPLAKQQIQQEVEEWQSALQAFGIQPEELEPKKIDLTIGPIHLFGKLEFLTSKGLLVRGKNQIEDRIRFWPHALLMKQLDLPVLFVKDHTSFTVEESFEEYLAYFQLAQKHPSPLIPTIAKVLLQEGDFIKIFKQTEDEIFSYLLFCDPQPNPYIIKQNWEKICRALFGRAFAKV